jgi:hypothetical protein
MCNGWVNPAGVRRDFAALEERRMEAARLLRAGSEVARAGRASAVGQPLGARA